MSLLNASPLLAAAGGEYEISRSVRLRSSASAWFSRTAGVPTNAFIWTISFWTKIGAGGPFIGGGTTTPNWLYTSFGDTGLQMYNPNTAVNMYLISSALFRDPSAWYHVVVAFDSTQATASNRVKFYVNGTQLTLSTATYPAQNSTFFWNQNGLQQRIGSTTGSVSFYDGYLAEFYGVDGQALTPSSFGETDAVTGVWKPKKYTGTYGTNGFYLNFSDPSAATAAAIGKDSSGNGNNWTPNNISVTAGVTYDSMIDTPTMYADGGNGRGNYCVLNPLKRSQAVAALTDGNLRFIGASGSYVDTVYGTIGVTGSGKYYFEVTGLFIAGFNTLDQNPTIDQTSGRVVYHGAAGSIFDASTAIQSGLATVNSTDVVGVALNLDAGTLAFYKNNVQVGTNVSINVTNTWWPFVQNTTSYFSHANFGQRPFAYTPPTGFRALNTQNLPESTIKRGDQWFDAATYTGNGTTQSIVNAGGMQPDFVWVKVRSAAYDHRLFDSSRPLNSWLSSNLTSAETNSTLNDNFLSYNSNGFSVGPTSGTNGLNQSGQTFVGWQWKESATAGFDIVTYTGTGANRTVAHSLGVAPRMIITKVRSTTGAWFSYHASLGAGQRIQLNETSAATASGLWQSTNPTSSVFSISSDVEINGSGRTYVAYCFAEVPGFSRFGSYTGNGSTDGPFVFCGFRPRFLLVKRTDSATFGNWEMIDTSRDTYNQAFLDLSANLSAAENATDGAAWDILSNGFKCRDGSSTGNKNVSGGTYIFAAFAEHPFKNALAR